MRLNSIDYLNFTAPHAYDRNPYPTAKRHARSWSDRQNRYNQESDYAAPDNKQGRHAK